MATAASRSAATGARAAVFRVLLLLSGFCGISYEILYGRVLSNFIGDQFAVSASILLTFLLGIGFGTLFAHRFWRALWLVEAGIGVSGLAIALGAGLIERWVYAGARAGGSLAGSVLVCFAVLTIPAFLIGCSLPLFAGYLGRISAGRVFARAYTVYNFGAALTAVLIEFWLLRLLGIRNAIIAIAALNGVVSVGLLALYGRVRERPPAEEASGRIGAGIAVPLAVASVASAIFQLLMIKLAECIIGPFRETFALILALILLGIAVGSALAGRLRLDFGRLMLIGLGALAWTVGGFGLVARAYATWYPAAVDNHFLIVLLKLGLLVALMGVPAVAFGATIPALTAGDGDVARQSGRLLFISSTANAAGFLLMAFVLHRYVDYGVLLIIVAALTAVAAVAYARSLGRVAVGAAALLIAVVGLERTVWDENLLYLGHTNFHAIEDLKAARADLEFPERFKGYQDVFSLSRTKGNVQFFINGFVSISLNSPAEKVVGAFASLFAPRTDRALVLGLGSGATAGTVARIFDHLDAVEINPIVVQNLYRMAPYNFEIEKQPNVTIIIDDGIHFTRVAPGQYSLIVNTVTTPLYFSSSKLYTRDFFESVRRKLTPDGVYMTWIDSRVGDRGMDIILRSLSQSFAECWMGAIKASYFVLVCSQQPLAVHQPGAAAKSPILAKYFFTEELQPEWLPYGLVSTRVLSLSGDKAAPVNTLDYPALEFEVARLDRRGIDAFKRRLIESMNLRDMAEALEPIGFDPTRLALYTSQLLEDSTITERWRTLASGSMPDFEARYGQAKETFYQSWASALQTAPAYRRHGAALLADGRYAEAIAEFRKALAIDPRTDNAWFDIGAAYEKSGQLEAALEGYTKELTVDATDADVPFRQGRVAVKLRMYDRAVSYLTQAVRVQETAAAQFYLGQALERLGRAAEARRAFERAVTLDPADNEARQAMVRLQSVGRKPGKD